MRVVYVVDTDPIRLAAAYLSIGTIRNFYDGDIALYTELEGPKIDRAIQKIVDKWDVTIHRLKVMPLPVGAQWPQYVALNIEPDDVDVFSSTATLWLDTPQKLVDHAHDADLALPLTFIDKLDLEDAELKEQEAGGFIPNPFYAGNHNPDDHGGEVPLCAKGCCGKGCFGIRVYNPVCVRRKHEEVSQMFSFWGASYFHWYRHGKHTVNRPEWRDKVNLETRDCVKERKYRNLLGFSTRLLPFRLVHSQMSTEEGHVCARIFAEDHLKFAQQVAEDIWQDAWNIGAKDLDQEKFMKAYRCFPNAYK